MAKKKRIDKKKFARTFSDASVRLLLPDPRTLRELFDLLHTKFSGRIQFDSIEPFKTEFVTFKFFKTQTDLVLKATLLDEQGKPSKQITIFILIEHQSEPDTYILARVLIYVAELMKEQLLEAIRKAKGNRITGFKFKPIIPIVFYTGTGTWTRLESIESLFEEGDFFADVLPRIASLFFNLPEQTDQNLRVHGGAFGQVLRLMQHIDDDVEDLEPVLREVVRELDKMPREEKDRWSFLLYYVESLIVHKRNLPETSRLRTVIEKTVDPSLLEEYNSMHQTYAQALKAQAREEEKIRSSRRILLNQVRAKFNTKVTTEIEQRIKSTKDVAQLERWLTEFATAKKIGDISFFEEEQT